jgi:hypothetical protein
MWYKNEEKLSGSQEKEKDTGSVKTGVDAVVNNT